MQFFKAYLSYPSRKEWVGGGGGGGAVAQSLELATPSQEVPGSISAVAACSLLLSV